HLAIRTKLESTQLNPFLSRNIPNSQSAIIAVSQTDRHSGVTLKNYSFDDDSEGLSLAVSSSDASGLGDALGLFSKVSCSFSALAANISLASSSVTCSSLMYMW